MREMDSYVSEILLRLGIPANLKGFRYLRSAIMLTLTDSSALDSVTKRLYPEVARLNNATAQQVETAIRRAVSCAWERRSADVDYVEKQLRCGFAVKGAKPTNHQLIALISDSVRLYGTAD